MTTDEAIKNEHKVDIPLKFLYKILSSNDNKSYNLVSLIMHYDEYLDCGNYASDVLIPTQEIGGTLMMTISLK